MLTCCGLSHAQPNKQTDIRTLSQHFIAEQNHAPWRFVPESNIRELSLSEHRGLVTIHEAGTGKDIKGLGQRQLSRVPEISDRLPAIPLRPDQGTVAHDYVSLPRKHPTDDRRSLQQAISAAFMERAVASGYDLVRPRTHT
jgi:hypothetical protein